MLQGHHRLIPARETPGGTAQQTLPQSPELSAAAGSAWHPALLAPFQGSIALARAPAKKEEAKSMRQVSNAQQMDGMVKQPVALMGHVCASDPASPGSSQSGKLLLCPGSSPSSTGTSQIRVASLIKLGCLVQSHLFELDSQHVDRIYVCLHLR